jgi:glycosyltransferase involved in cell wall biosynthesis
MKITHLLLSHSFAGTERYVVELANAQAMSGHEVTVILHKRAAEDRPNSFAHRFNEKVRQLFVGGPSWIAFWWARQVVQKLQTDVAHAHLSGGCRAIQSLRATFLRVATLHIHYKPQQHRGMDALIAIAPWQMKEIPPDQLACTEQINNWTQATKPDASAREKIRTELGIPPDTFLIGALCRAEKSKGLDVLIDAYLTNPPANSRLVIVGGGRDWKALRKKAPANILMPGFVTRPQDWFSAFDGYVSAARYEPFGLVFLEAFAAGLPVLSTATEGAQIFQALIGRPLLKCGDIHSMTEGLQHFLSERPAKRTYDLSDFTYENQVNRVEAFYKKQWTRQRSNSLNEKITLQ